MCMLALALLLVSFIGLVWLIVRLLQNYFDACNGLQTTEKTRIAEIQNHLKLQENTSKILEMEKQINAQISKRLTEMEEKFPSEETQEEVPGMFIENVQKMLRSTLNTLKNRTSQS